MKSVYRLLIHTPEELRSQIEHCSECKEAAETFFEQVETAKSMGEEFIGFYEFLIRAPIQHIFPKGHVMGPFERLHQDRYFDPDTQEWVPAIEKGDD